jgi:hypothetical protein
MINEVPIDRYILTRQAKTRSLPSTSPVPILPDPKGRKVYEPRSIEQNDKNTSSPKETYEKEIIRLLCNDESDFLRAMQQVDKQMYQGNVSPSIFVQRMDQSPYAVCYRYCRSSRHIHVTSKHAAHRSSSFYIGTECRDLPVLIDFVANKLVKDQRAIQKSTMPNHRMNTDHLLGSLPLSVAFSENFLLVRPHAIDRESALKDQCVAVHGPVDPGLDQWFEPLEANEDSTLDCAICCESFSTGEMYQLLPCECIEHVANRIATLFVFV